MMTLEHVFNDDHSFADTYEWATTLTMESLHNVTAEQATELVWIETTREEAVNAVLAHKPTITDLIMCRYFVANPGP